MTRLAAALTVFLAAGIAAARAQAPTETTPLAAAVMARLAALPDRTAIFTAEKHLSSLSQPLESAGRLVFRHPAHMEKHTVSPRAEDVIIDGGALSITVPGSAPRNLALDANPGLQALAGTIGAVLAGDLAWLQQLYAVDASGSIGSWTIMLRPRESGLAHFIRSVNLAGTGGDLRSFALVQANGDSEIMTFQPGP